MNLFRSFGYATLILFIAYFLYFNVLMAMNINPFPGFIFGQDVVYWNDNYYFGFNSVYNILSNFPEGLSIARVSENLKNFIESLTGLGATFQKLANGDITAIEGIFELLFALIVAPIKAITYFILLNVEILTTIYNIIRYFIEIITGNYNQNNLISNWNSPNIIWVEGFYTSGGDYIPGHYEYFDGLIYNSISNGVVVPSYTGTWITLPSGTSISGGTISVPMPTIPPISVPSVIPPTIPPISVPPVIPPTIPPLP